MTKLTVYRVSDTCYPFSRLIVHVDGRPVGELANGATETFTIEPGEHKVEAAFANPLTGNSVMHSEPIYVDIMPGQDRVKLTIRCNRSFLSKFFIWSILRDAVNPRGMYRIEEG